MLYFKYCLILQEIGLPPPSVIAASFTLPARIRPAEAENKKALPLEQIAAAKVAATQSSWALSGPLHSWMITGSIATVASPAEKIRATTEVSNIKVWGRGYGSAESLLTTQEGRSD